MEQIQRGGTGDDIASLIFRISLIGNAKTAARSQGPQRGPEAGGGRLDSGLAWE